MAVMFESLSRREFLHWVGLAAACRAIPADNTARPAATDWQLLPSFVFDTLCFLNTLSGDPFYLTYYQADFDAFVPKLTADARRALANVKKRVKDDGKNIISAFLCLHFSASDAQTLDDMRRALDDPAPMQRALRQTAYYSDGGWKLFLQIRPDLQTIFRFLADIGFEDFWRQTVLPKVRARIEAIAPTLRSFNVIAEDEAVLGAALPSNAVTIFLLYFNKPHGIRLSGPRFVSNLAWPLPVTVRNAAHELLHPPYHWSRDKELRDALLTLRKDDFLMDKVNHHNPSFGYNSLESYLEENCVRALDQMATEKLGIGGDARRRWKEEDDGMHVFAAALYAVMQQERYPSHPEPFRNFLLRQIQTGKLAPGQIRPVYDQWYKGT